MKNEKFCFSKGTGLIALVGVLLVGFVLLTQATNQQTSTSSRASGVSCKQQSGNWYSDASCAALSTRFGTTFLAAAETPNDASLYTGKVCCVAQREPTVAPGGNPTCTEAAGGKGNWYNKTSYATCADLATAANTGYEAKTPISDTKTGYICCKATLQPTMTADEKAMDAKKSSATNKMCFRPSIGRTCDAVSAVMKAPMAAVLATDAVYKDDCKELTPNAPLACKAVRNLCDTGLHLMKGGQAYAVTAYYPNTFVMKSGVVWCKVVAVTTPTGKVNTDDSRVCAQLKADGFHATSDGTADLGAITGTRDANGFCTL